MMEKTNQFEKKFTIDGWIIGLIILTIIVLAVALHEGPQAVSQEQEVLVSDAEREVSPTAAVKAAVEAKKQRHMNSQSFAENAPMKTDLSREDRARLLAIITGGS